MDHLDAEKMKAVERYMLGDLAVSEVEEFERHFFDCPQCSEELRALTIFQENARAVFAEQVLAPVAPRVTVPESAARVPEGASGWWRGFSPLWSSSAVACAALLIGVFSGYLTFRSRDEVQAVATFPLYTQARGEETVVSPAAGSNFYTLYLDRTWDADYTRYAAVLRDASGAQKFSTPVKPGAAGAAIYVLVPTHKLDAGHYVLTIEGVDGAGKATELARSPFTLRFE
jgi:hypothetical protein